MSCHCVHTYGQVEDTMYDDTNNTMLNNNKNEMDKKENNIIKTSNVNQKMYVLSIVYEAHFLKQMNVFEDLLKNKKKFHC